MANDERHGSLADVELQSPVSSPSPYVVVSLLMFISHQLAPLHNFVGFKLTVLWSLVELPFWAQRSGKIID